MHEVTGSPSVDTYTEQQDKRPCQYGSRCWGRTCLRCQEYRCQAIRKKIVMRQTHEKYVYHITLTMRSVGLPLGERLSRLRDGFTGLRRRGIWRRHVRGGAYAIHVVGAKSPHRWHPHMHVVAGADPAGEKLEELGWGNAWLQITGDSTDVLVQEVSNLKEEPWRLANYVVRPVFAPFRDKPDMLKEFEEESHARPLTGFLGRWRGDDAHHDIGGVN
jgi:hypothetical protein